MCSGTDSVRATYHVARGRTSRRPRAATPRRVVRVGLDGPPRAAAARVGRRWRDVRGPLIVAAGLAVLQAALVYCALRAIQELGAVAVAAACRSSPPRRSRWCSGWASCATPSAPSCRFGQAPAARILEVVEAARPALREGLSAGQRAHPGRGDAPRCSATRAVAVTDRGRVLAHVGLGGDHHGAGTAAPPGRRGRDDGAARRPPAGRLAARLRRRDCPLRSAVVAPIARAHRRRSGR